MGQKQNFLSINNFDLAFDRLTTSTNHQYKSFFRHHYAAYNLAKRENLLHLIADIKSNKFEPKIPTNIYAPKASGVLRPIALLHLNDQIVYQAIVNIIGQRFYATQKRYSGIKTFGATLNSGSNIHFYQHWKLSYQKFQRAIRAIYSSGAQYYSNFDLVSFYELIDHRLLHKTLSQKVDGFILDLLSKCLERWTGNKAGQLGHGVPQGPPPSAFLAECILFALDQQDMKGVYYIRYIDDICLMSDNPHEIRRSLMRLDLMCKELGLVPQAQKITAPIKASSVEEITTSLPSMVLAPTAAGTPRQRELTKLLNSSTRKELGIWRVTNKTHFKYAIGRLNPNHKWLKKITSVAETHPEFSPEISRYFIKFGIDKLVARKILGLLTKDPVYDAAASAYLAALDACEGPKPDRMVNALIQKVCNVSVERTITPRIAAAVFRGRRSRISTSFQHIRWLKDPLSKSIALDRLFGTSPDAPFNGQSALPLISELCKSQDPDLARYSAYLGITFGRSTWTNPTRSNPSVGILLNSTGHISAKIKKSRVLDVYFDHKLGINVPIDWAKALGNSLRQTEMICLQIQAYSLADQDARILLIDSFNDGLLQRFCTIHPKLKKAYAKAAGKNHHPDLGAWLNQNDLAAVVPGAAQWFKDLHNARIKIPLAHFADKKKGTINKPMKKRDAEKLLKGAKTAWAALLVEWIKYL